MRIIQLEKQFKWAGQTQQTFHTARELLRRGHDVLLVCQPGSAVAVKAHAEGIPTLLRAAQFVCAKTSRAKFLLVGRNSERVRVRADSCGLGQRVILPGFRNDVPALLSVMDVYVQPSLREAVSCSILQAMACGKPVLATRVGGIPEAVADGETGRLFQLGDAEGMAEAILELMSQPATLEQMGRNSRARVEKVLGLERMIDEVEDVYRSVLHRS